MENQNQELEVAVNTNSPYSLKGIVEVFYAPSELFKRVKDNPKILVPYIVLMCTSLLVGLLLSDLILQVQLASPEFQANLQGQEVTEGMIQILKVTAIIGMVISMALVPLITAGLALFFGNFVMGGKATYKQMLSTMLYCEVLFMVGELLLIPMVLAKGSLTAGISLGFLAADQGVQSLAFVALSKISLFHIWEIVVAGIGLSTIYGFTRNKGYILAVLSLGLLSMIHIGVTALGAMLK